jgi:hypothetical protein
VLLRTPAEQEPEIWCRCDGGPHGFLSIAAHAHADALSLEVRHDGIDILADPGTYCYHGEPEWRLYFRSTKAHNTVRVDDRDQSASAGPFLWRRHAATTVLRDETGVDGDQMWEAVHDGYQRLSLGSVRHQRAVRLMADHTVVVSDLLTSRGNCPVELLFHLGPLVTAVVDGAEAHLTWPGSAGPLHATLSLPGELTWAAYRGETDPPLGWYSPRFGRRVPSTTLVGSGKVQGTQLLVTELAFQGVPSRTLSRGEVRR